MGFMYAAIAYITLYIVLSIHIFFALHQDSHS
jgi:hypothetical protein